MSSIHYLLRIFPVIRLKKEILANTYPPIPWIFAPRKDRWECGEDARPLDLSLKSCLITCQHLCHPLTLKFPINLSESVEQTKMKMQRVVKVLSCWFFDSTSFRLVWFNFLWWVKRWLLEMLERVLLCVIIPQSNLHHMLTTYELMIQELFGNLTPVSSQICLSIWFGSSTSKVLHWYRRGQGFENCSGRVSSFMQALFSQMPTSRT